MSGTPCADSFVRQSPKVHESLVNMGGVASKPGNDPDYTLQVIGAGFSRTGTVTMALALEKILDGPVCHGGTQMHMLEESALHRFLAQKL